MCTWKQWSSQSLSRKQKKRYRTIGVDGGWFESGLGWDRAGGVGGVGGVVGVGGKRLCKLELPRSVNRLPQCAPTGAAAGPESGLQSGPPRLSQHKQPLPQQEKQRNTTETQPTSKFSQDCCSLCWIGKCDFVHRKAHFWWTECGS